MKSLITIAFGFLLTVTLFGQDNRVNEIIKQGIALHDQQKYEEAVEKYKEALKIDNNSAIANYEISYTYFSLGKYDDAIKHGKKIIEKNSECLHEAVIVLGNSYDMKGEFNEAVKFYEWGLLKFPESNMLNYNLAVSYFKAKYLDKAEQAAIKAVELDPTHASSQLLLSGIMENKNQRIKAILAIYHFLLIENDSKRSLQALNKLKELLMLGVKKESEQKINITLPSSSSSGDPLSAAETMISLIGATRYIEKNKNMTDIEYFVDFNKTLFSYLGEIKKENKGIWWDLYVKEFQDLARTNNYEAYSYYIQKSLNSDEVNKWIATNKDKMNSFMIWMRN